MKRFFLLFVLLGASASLVSISPASAEAYFGFQTGINRGDVKTAGVGKQDRVFEGGAMAGYEVYFGEGWFAGLEGFINLRTFNEAEVKSNYRSGVGLVVGKQLSTFADVFGFIGPQWEHWKVPARASGGVKDAEFNDTILGFHLGVGARYIISPQWQLRVQYQYARAQDEYVRTTTENNVASRSMLDITANSHNMTFGFTRSF